MVFCLVDLTVQHIYANNCEGQAFWVRRLRQLESVGKAAFSNYLFRYPRAPLSKPVNDTLGNRASHSRQPASCQWMLSVDNKRDI